MPDSIGFGFGIRHTRRQWWQQQRNFSFHSSDPLFLVCWQYEPGISRHGITTGRWWITLQEIAEDTSWWRSRWRHQWPKPTLWWLADWTCNQELAATDRLWPIVVTVSVLCALEDHHFLQSLSNVIVVPLWQFRLLCQHKCSNMYFLTYSSGLLRQDFTDQMMSFIGQLTASKH